MTCHIHGETYIIQCCESPPSYWSQLKVKDLEGKSEEVESECSSFTINNVHDSCICSLPENAIENG